MKEEKCSNTPILEIKIDLLTTLVQELILEIRTLRSEIQEFKSKDPASTTYTTKQDTFLDPNNTPIIEGDICKILNS